MLNTILTSLSTAAPTIVSGIAVLILSDLYKGLKKLIRWISQRIQKVFSAAQVAEKRARVERAQGSSEYLPQVSAKAAEPAKAGFAPAN
ncbi:hypothetical protein STRDD11_00497 [Streptococcus sp. DD11]|uniref:hypothetical protein n=1 Tax=Streptococcus sp. DD11 TaxID=1777879 RepID=UPI0007945F0D|nr:hypothetical protein [Streptococcus sp. DD11]KXT85193.1 hypothetical protein STRDD11_00497 [Streptococcus sp. DD11]